MYFFISLANQFLKIRKVITLKLPIYYDTHKFLAVTMRNKCLEWFTAHLKNTFGFFNLSFGMIFFSIGSVAFNILIRESFFLWIFFSLYLLLSQIILFDNYYYIPDNHENS